MPLLSTLGGGSLHGWKVPGGDAGPPEFSTAADTEVASVFADTSYPTTINESNMRDFWCWSTKQAGADGSKGSANYFMFFPKSDTTRAWRSAYIIGSSSWYIDLGMNRNITRIQWYAVDGQSNLQYIKWYGSTDGANWTELWNASNPGSSNNTDYDTGVQSTWNYRYLQYKVNHTGANYGSWNNLTITLDPVTQINSQAITAVDPDGETVTYSLTAGTLPTGVVLDTANGKLIPDANKIPTTGYNANGAVSDFTIRATDEKGNWAERQFKIRRLWRDGSQSSRHIYHVGAGVKGLYNITAGTFTSGTKYVMTPNGGIQQCYVLNDGKGDGWIQLARYQYDASNTVRSGISSIRGLSDISQGGGNHWSADFGGAEADAVMVWGSSDFSDQTVSSNTKVNWVYKIARGDSSNSHGKISAANRITLWHWIFNDGNPGSDKMNNNSRTAFGNVNQHGYNLGDKCGQICFGASDGPFKNNRWDNTAYRGHRQSDNSNNPGAEPLHFFETNGDMMGINAAEDAKWGVHATGSNGGQDTDSSQLFGWDDGNGPAYYDMNTGTEGQNSTRHDFGGGGNGPAATLWWTQGYTRMGGQ